MNSNGGITLDFIFALVLVLSMTLLLGVFSFSLAIIESSQYIAYSTSRAYFPSHINQETQRREAEEKFEELTKSSGFKSFLKPDLFKLTVDRIGDFGDIYQRATVKDVLEGVRLKMVLGILDIQLPGLGTTQGQPYETFVTSLLGRESTSEECQSFMQQRLNALFNVPGSTYSSSSIQPAQYFAFEDNGC